MADGVPEVIEQQGGHVLADAQPDQNALHGYTGGCSGEGVGGYLPASGAQPVSEVEQGVAGVLAVAYPPGHRQDPIADAPTVLAAWGACHRSASMWTQVRPTSGRRWPGSAGRCHRASARPTPPGMPLLPVSRPSGTDTWGQAWSGRARRTRNPPAADGQHHARAGAWPALLPRQIMAGA